MTTTLQVNEIYLSLQGEGCRAGLPCVLVRLTGCNLHCRWCDTPRARTEGREMSLDEIVDRVVELGCRRVEVTGGEPLTQPACAQLIGRLCEMGCETLLETNGSLDIRAIDPRAIRIVDFKCPASGEHESNRWDNVSALAARDEVKFVLADRRDYEFARDAVARHALLGRCPVIFSPVHGTLPAADLAGWILADGLDVRLGLQLHKMVWPNQNSGI